jgi:hypothetical protein
MTSKTRRASIKRRWRAAVHRAGGRARDRQSCTSGSDTVAFTGDCSSQTGGEKVRIWRYQEGQWRNLRNPELLRRCCPRRAARGYLRYPAGEDRSVSYSCGGSNQVFGSGDHFVWRRQSSTVPYHWILCWANAVILIGEVQQLAPPPDAEGAVNVACPDIGYAKSCSWIPASACATLRLG